jgi:hypothetical protein
MILVGALGGFLLVQSCKELFGMTAALIAAPMIMLDPSLLMHSRIDWGPTALMFFFRGLVIYGIAIWAQQGRPLGFWITLGATALGVFDKLNFVWIGFAIIPPLLLSFTKNLRIYLNKFPKSAVMQMAMLFMILGSAVLRAKHIVNNNFPVVTKTWYERIGEAGNLLQVAIVGNGPLSVVGYDGTDPKVWMILAYLFVLVSLTLALRARGLAKLNIRNWLFITIFAVSLICLFFLTFSATGPHHSAVIAGLPGLIFSPIIAAYVSDPTFCKLPGRLIKFCLLGSVAILVLCMVTTSLVSIKGFAHPKNFLWDPVNNKIGEFPKNNRSAVFYTSDWGLGTQLICTTGGLVIINDNWPQFKDSSSAKQVLKSIPRDRDSYLVAHSPGLEIFPDAQAGLNRALHELNMTIAPVETVFGWHGKPIIVFYKLPRPN